MSYPLHTNYLYVDLESPAQPLWEFSYRGYGEPISAGSPYTAIQYSDSGAGIAIDDVVMAPFANSDGYVREDELTWVKLPHSNPFLANFRSINDPDILNK